jgi:hypothetical protein
LLAPKSSGEATVETLLERVPDTILRDHLQGACHLLESAPPHDRDRAATRGALADAYADQGRAADPERHYRAALALEPGLAPAWNNLGLLLRATGHPEQGNAAFGRAPAAEAGNHSSASAGPLTMHYRDDVDAVAIADAHFSVGARVAEAAVLTPPPVDGPSQVGFVFADVGCHVVAAFLGALFARLDPHEVQGYRHHAGSLGDPQTASLRAVAHAPLLLKARGLERPLAARRVRVRVQTAGGEVRNLVPEGATPDSASHLARCGAVDTGSGRVPYDGATICEAMCMGVPAVTLAGNRHAARVGARIRARGGHPGWVARTPAEFVSVATQLAANRPTLARVRAGLRASVATGPLADAAGFARNFQQARRALVSPC